MRQYAFFLVLLIGIVSCNKDKFETKPTLEIKSTTGNFIPIGAGLAVTMEFTDKEGDISNTLFVQKIRLNKKAVKTVRDTFSLTVPEFPTKSKGDITVNLQYINHLQSAEMPPTVGSPPNVRFEDDTLTIRFALRDLKGNVSDTVSIGTVIVSRN